MGKFFMDHKGAEDWAVRRRIIILSLIWAAMLITYLAIWGRPIALSDSALTNLCIVFGSIIGSYVFGAIWDNKVKMSADTAQTAVDQSAPTTTSVDVKI
jgi:DMSO reductase anchor subunit